ncbi:MAG: dTDP-4-amino-4,6-dideoxygalactose transaminase [Bdellovibrionaceae bacterium]|nr:dTDP-4-amino-4,6-dideoxygalactose transaminase [Pseudobdellovibrionaceae bacterium]
MQTKNSDLIVPFNKPSFLGSELEYITDAIRQGHISGDGSYTKKCTEFFEKEFSLPKCLLTTSCTDALEMAALLLNINPGDEILVPSFTFVSTVNAFILRGARPVFVDIRPDTLNIDESILRKKITSKTKAIIPVHYAGVGCEMDDILSIAKEHNIAVIEDNAHGLFGKYKGKNLGTFGALATQSFHETKNFTCGEGGALFINDSQYIARAEILRDKGTNRKQFYRGLVDKYTWVDIGSSFLPSDILSAFLYAQLEHATNVQEKRRQIWNFYFNALSEWSKHTNTNLPFVPPHCEQAYHMFYVITPSLEFRSTLMEHLQSKGIYSVFHYTPLHLSEMGKKLGGKLGSCPITEDISNRILRLPFFTSLSIEQTQLVVESLYSFKP